jgi:hypothetical protein
VRLKNILEARQGQECNTTALAIFKEMSAAMRSYYRHATGKAYVVELSNWCEPYRANIEYCINYLICFSDQYWNDSYDELYQYILNIMDVHSRRRKLALLIA